MSKIWFISDTHFGHKNIIEYCDRPFNNVEQMNKEIIKKWNKVVRGGDKVYHLGDFAFYNDKDKMTELVKKLNGDIYLIKGNHDKKSSQWYRDCGFKEVYDKPIVFEEFYILSHEPKPFIAETRLPLCNIFGHVHDSTMFKTFGSRHACVCVERHDYAPIDFENIKVNIG